MTAPTTRPTPRRRWVGIGLGLGWIATLLATIFALHTLGHGNLSAPPMRTLPQFRAWLDQRDTPTAAFALLRLGSLALTWYLLAVTVLGLTARAVRSPRLVLLADAVTLPVARRLMATVAGVTLSASTASLVALPLLPQFHRRPPVASSNADDSRDHTRGTAPADHRVVSHRSADDTTVVMRRIPRPHVDSTATMRVIEERPGAPPERPPAPSPVTTWTVQPGDSFWAVAHRVLTESWHRPPTDVEVVPYWQHLIARNRSRLVDSHNADLVYPGQVFELPTPPPQP